jgi:hypothetical protein
VFRKKGYVRELGKGMGQKRKTDKVANRKKTVRPGTVTLVTKGGVHFFKIFFLVPRAAAVQQGLESM